MLQNRLTLIVFMSTLLAAFAGCGNTGPKSGAAGSADKKDSATSSAATAADDTPGLKELSAEDRKLAEKQKVCPVSGEKLGSMGKPYKITLQGHSFFLCCDGCEETVKKEPDKYLKKVDELLATK